MIEPDDMADALTVPEDWLVVGYLDEDEPIAVERPDEGYRPGLREEFRRLGLDSREEYKTESYLTGPVVSVEITEDSYIVKTVGGLHRIPKPRLREEDA